MPLAGGPPFGGGGPGAPWSSPSPQAPHSGPGQAPTPRPPSNYGNPLGHMTTVTESPWRAGGRRKGHGSHTQLWLVPAQHCCSSSPITAAAALGRGAGGPRGEGGAAAGWRPCVLACSLCFLHLASSSVGSSLPPTLVGTSVALGSPQNPPRLATTSQFLGKPLAAPAGQEANIFVSSGTRLRDPGFSFSDTSPGSPSAAPASQVLCQQPALWVQAYLSQAPDGDKALPHP